jgi:membrane glycosyltransferase
MPEQSLCHAPVPRGGVPALDWRRLPVVGGAAMMTLVAGWQMSQVVGVDRLAVLDVVLVGLFGVLFFWLALSATSALAGLIALAMGDARVAPLPPPDRPLAKRTALLMPLYNETVADAVAALEAMLASLQEQAAAHAFDAFILSDSTDPAIIAAEHAAWRQVAERLRGRASVFLVRRTDNHGRKAGNVANWVRRFGAAYQHFVVLDADSVMDGATLVALAAAMERDPRLGLLQSLPLLVGAQTLLGRLQQFAARVHGPVIAAGLAWWHGDAGNYWGHNAIIRTRAFADSAGLPALRGRRPWRGDILSHDFVEAALLRRAGWHVRMAPAVAGSYERAPQTLHDLAARDRRWCQGNLQHAALLAVPGLHWVSRLHFATGIAAYGTAPLWLAFLLLGAVVAGHAHLVGPRYFPDTPVLFPLWPVIDAARAQWVFAGTLLVLLLPKLFGLLWLLADRLATRAAGGASRVVAGAVLEIMLAGLLAPVTMLTQTGQVFAILLGGDAGWASQRRDAQGAAWAEAARRYWPHTLLGLVLSGAVLVSPALAAWMAPVFIGLLAAVPLAQLVGTPAIGMAMARAVLLATPEERRAPPVLRRAGIVPAGNLPRHVRLFLHHPNPRRS